MDLAELRIRYARQGAKAPFKTKEQNQIAKESYKYITKQQTIENPVDKWYNIVRERKRRLDKSD